MCFSKAGCYITLKVSCIMFEGWKRKMRHPRKRKRRHPWCTCASEDDNPTLANLLRDKTGMGYAPLLLGDRRVVIRVNHTRAKPGPRPGRTALVPES